MLKYLGSFLVLCGLVSVAYGQNNVPPKDLYTTDVNIAELNVTNFANIVYCTKKDLADCPSYVVQFYTSASEYSRNYSEVFSKVGKEANGWKKDIVHLAAVNCHRVENTKLCNQHNFKRLPVLKYFYRKSTIGSPGHVFETNARYEHILERIAEKINKEYWQNLYSDWPNFTVLPDYTNSTTELWETLNDCNTSFLLILVNNVTDFDGMNLLIKARKVSKPSLPIRRITKDHKLVALLGNPGPVYPEPVMLKRPLTTGENCTIPISVGVMKLSEIIGSLGTENTATVETVYDNGATIVERRARRFTKLSL